MAVIINCKNPRFFLDIILRKMQDRNEEEWIVDEMGDLTLSSPEFIFKAWLRPSLLDDGIAFGIIGQENVDMTSRIYAAFHSRLVEYMLFEFDDKCDSIFVSPMPTVYDSFE